MFKSKDRAPWRQRLKTPQAVMDCIEPGMSIFLGTGVGEPRTLVKHLMASEGNNLQDLELIQLVSLGDAISLQALRTNRYRLKTFFSGWVASEAISEGLVDLIPIRFSQIPDLIKSGQMPIDIAFVQITPPNEAGFCSLGVAVDVARQAIEKASLVVGEINPQIPQTFGDTFIAFDDFDLVVEATQKPIYFPRMPVDDVLDRVAANAASVIQDGSCLAFSPAPLFEALSKHLVHKRDLGIHSPFFTDALMDLVKSGAVTNRRKEVFRGKSLTTYAFGTPDLMKWLDCNPLVEFQGLDKVINPVQVGSNPRFVAILPARKVDLSGRVALHIGKGNVTAGPGDTMDHLNSAEISDGGFSMFALTSRNLKQEPNIRLSVESYPNQFSLRESVDMVVTEYGVAPLKGRTLRERAQALIEVAHPDDRAGLIDAAKKANVIYQDQLFLEASAHLYPSEISARHTFKEGVTIKFRAIKPSDEEEMRRLFYRFSDKSVYYRYFSPIKTMPHTKMQAYVNVDFSRTMSIVGLASDAEHERIIAEARFARDLHQPYADVAFIVDEAYQSMGIASYLYQMLLRLAKERGIKGFTADVLASNKGMIKVFEKGAETVQAKFEQGCYALTIPFESKAEK